MYSSVPEALECLRQHCSNSFKTLVKIINLNSRYEKDEVTFKYNNSYVPLTRTDFIWLQEFERNFKKNG